MNDKNAGIVVTGNARALALQFEDKRRRRVSAASPASGPGEAEQPAARPTTPRDPRKQESRFEVSRQTLFQALFDRQVLALRRRLFCGHYIGGATRQKVRDLARRQARWDLKQARTLAAALLVCAVLVLSGCGAYHATVYGASGRAYTAPDLCAAQIACQKAGETGCSYVADEVQRQDGSTETAYCKTVK